jgi:hypothetical protein
MKTTTLTTKQNARVGLAALLCACMSAGGLAGCGAGFQSTSLIDSNGSLGSSPTPDGKSPSRSEWENLKVEGAVSDGRFEGTSALRLDKAKKELVIRLPMPANPFLDGAFVALPVPQMPGGQIDLEPLPEGGSALVLRVPLSAVLKGVNFAQPSKLPNGDPLPGVPDGELPSVAMDLTKLTDIKARIYLGPSVVGIFVNTPFNPMIYLRFPIRNADNTRTWGYLYSIPAKHATNDGGFFLTVALPDDIARIIDDHI